MSRHKKKTYIEDVINIVKKNIGFSFLDKILELFEADEAYQNNIIEIECRDKKDAEKLLKKWYLERAKVKFNEYAQPIIEHFSTFGVKPNKLTVKKMDKRWGYCTTDGCISLNPRLICAPRCCIEYVITHELCHLVYRNHTKDFYALLSKEMPHWEKWKMKLERMLV